MTFTYSVTEITPSVLASSIVFTQSPTRTTTAVTASGVTVGAKPDRYFTDIEMTCWCGTTELTTLLSFLKTTVGIRGNQFTVTPDSGVDLGAGDGDPVTVILWENVAVRHYGVSSYYVDIVLRRVST